VVHGTDNEVDTAPPVDSELGVTPSVDGVLVAAPLLDLLVCSEVDAVPFANCGPDAALLPNSEFFTAIW